MSVRELFCAVDDFMLSFGPQLKATQIAAGKQRQRSGQLWPSEIMTILISFHQSHSRTFKAYDTEHVQVHLTSEFPQQVELYALCGPYSFHDASPVGLCAKPIWGLHWYQFH